MKEKWTAKEKGRQPERESRHVSIRGFISNSPSLHKGAEPKSLSALAFLFPTSENKSGLQQQRSASTHHVRCQSGTFEGFAGCVRCSRLISAWRCWRTKHGVMPWSDRSQTRPRRKRKMGETNAARGRDKQRRETMTRWQKRQRKQETGTLSWEKIMGRGQEKPSSVELQLKTSMNKWLVNKLVIKCWFQNAAYSQFFLSWFSKIS